jgi:hypothetical protein
MSQIFRPTPYDLEDIVDDIAHRLARASRPVALSFGKLEKAFGITADAMTPAADKSPRGLNWTSTVGSAGSASPNMPRCSDDIDAELLGRLTNDDLKDIGVASFGHRKKLLEAIAELAGAVPAPVPPC